MARNDKLKEPAGPNILLIIADQHRADTLGYHGTIDIRTPHIDSLVQNGVVFERALSPCPLCTPARCSIFTSLYPHQARGFMGVDPHGIFEPLGDTDMTRNGTSLREPPMLTRTLREAGYFTGYAGKWHLGPDIIDNWFGRTWEYNKENKEAYTRYCREKGLPDGVAFNDMAVRSQRAPYMSTPVTRVSPVPAESSPDAYIVDRALEILNERPGYSPFFMVCGFEGPHPPFKIPEPYYSMYDPADIPEPPNFRPADPEPQGNKNSYYRRLWEDHGGDWENWKKSVAVYRGFVTLIDDQVGRLIEFLDSRGLRNDTIIIYCSDHGEMLGQHGLWHKMTAYQESVRVPLIVSGKNVRSNYKSPAKVSLLDIAPTILSLAGLAIPDSYEGVDLKPLLGGSREDTGRDYLFCEQRNLGPFHAATDWRMITDNQYKFIRNRDDMGELYDLRDDPWEIRNLISDAACADERARLEEALEEWMLSTGDSMRVDFRQARDVNTQRRP